VSPEKIIFNGPNKNEEILRRAVSEGARIHIDHMDELRLLERVAKDLDKVVAVSLRLNFDTGFSEPWYRFGFNIESGQAHHAASAVAFS
ncbi:MAG TPA: diaminopimelate decarboxylase, partial [Candidatus Melainabacteria bacterium]|nr:diaminopimelate decarboxylase [Candidatus Melainabacteria bacterium]